MIPHINTPLWQRAVEAQQHAHEVTKFMINHDMKDTGLTDSGWRVDQALLGAGAPYAWSAETIEAVLAASRSIPLDTRLSRWNLSTPTVWWWFEEPLPFDTIHRKDHGIRALSFGWLRADTESRLGMPCVAWLDNDVIASNRFPIQPSQTWEWETQHTIAEMLAETREFHERKYGPGGRYAHIDVVPVEQFMTACEGIARFVLAGLAWLEQRILVPRAEHVERHARKRFERSVGRQLGDVQLIELRKIEYQQDEGNKPRKVDWACRWMVDGHWRHQPCGPGYADRRLTFIMPFVKGPADKPLRVAPRKVYKVDR